MNAITRPLDCRGCGEPHVFPGGIGFDVTLCHECVLGYHFMRKRSGLPLTSAALEQSIEAAEIVRAERIGWVLESKRAFGRTCIRVKLSENARSRMRHSSLVFYRISLALAAAKTTAKRMRTAVLNHDGRVIEDYRPAFGTYELTPTSIRASISRMVTTVPDGSHTV